MINTNTLLPTFFNNATHSNRNWQFAKYNLTSCRSLFDRKLRPLKRFFLFWEKVIVSGEGRSLDVISLQWRIHWLLLVQPFSHGHSSGYLLPSVEMSLRFWVSHFKSLTFAIRQLAPNLEMILQNATAAWHTKIFVVVYRFIANCTFIVSAEVEVSWFCGKWFLVKIVLNS